MTTPDSLGEALKHWRTSSGFTLREASSRVAADFTYLSKIEHGHDRPSRRLVEQLDATYHADGALLAAYAAEPCPRCGQSAALAQPEPVDRRMLEWVAAQPIGFGGDWACVECRPKSDMLVAGFRCMIHEAHHLLALPTTTEAPE